MRLKYGQELLWDPYLNPNLEMKGGYLPNDLYLGMDVDDFQFKKVSQLFMPDSQKT